MRSEEDTGKRGGFESVGADAESQAQTVVPIETGNAWDDSEVNQSDVIENTHFSWN